ncbi:hypothetical protein SB761_28840, partial [Pseudomonas sp. SIMBA_064]
RQRVRRERGSAGFGSVFVPTQGTAVAAVEGRNGNRGAPRPAPATSRAGITVTAGPDLSGGGINTGYIDESSIIASAAGCGH